MSIDVHHEPASARVGEGDAGPRRVLELETKLGSL